MNLVYALLLFLALAILVYGTSQSTNHRDRAVAAGLALVTLVLFIQAAKAV